MNRNRIWSPLGAALAAASIAVIGTIVLLGTADWLFDFAFVRKTFWWAIELRQTLGTELLTLATGLLMFAASFVFILTSIGRKAAAVDGSSFRADRPGGWLFRTIRWRLLLAFFGSIVVTILLLGLLFLAAFFVFRAEPFRSLAEPLLQFTGIMPIVGIAGCLLFLAVFFLLSNRIIRYLREITEGLQRIAGGRLDYEIPVRTNDELGEVAYNINQMSRKLSASIEEERNAEKTKNDLITGVSHDLRTPLTSILGFLELIDNDRYKDEVELRYYVTIAYEKSKSLKKLIDDLFDFTRINNGMPLEKIRLDLVGFVRQLLEEFVPSLTEAGMAGRVYADPAPLMIMADGDRLVRAFENLISNAIRYGEDGRYVDVRLRREDGWAVAEVVNYGVPIPEKDLPYLFERFYRVEQSRSKQTGGTGLGLAIAKSIVELHDGTIAVRSGRGETAFELRFPLMAGQTEAK